LQKADSSNASLSSAGDVGKKSVLEQRRCLILAIVGSTSADFPSVSRIISNGYLSHIKVWLDEILKGSVGKLEVDVHVLWWWW
jgi:hypothetical protein